MSSLRKEGRSLELREKSMNWVSNYFRIYRILETWPPAIIICFHASRRGCVVGVLSGTKKLDGKQNVYGDDLNIYSQRLLAL